LTEKETIVGKGQGRGVKEDEKQKLEKLKGDDVPTSDERKT